jgi:transitional endoplasmic reticulum ATPase
LSKLERKAEVPEFVARATRGFSGRDLRGLVHELVGELYTTAAAEACSEITAEMWRAAVARLARCVRGADESARWDTLVLSEDTIRQLKTMCEDLRQMATLQREGIELPREVLLFGPPGTGKTQIARTLANESGLAFIAARPSDIKARYVGQSGQKVRELFERAHGDAPCILFIDEIEACAASRDGGKTDPFTGEIVTELLAQMEAVKKSGHHVFVLAATNYPERVDSALLSRFTHKIAIPNPTVSQRERLFRIFLGQCRRVDFDIEQAAIELGRRGGNISGRDIHSLVQRASVEAMRRAMEAGSPLEFTVTREDLFRQLAPPKPGTAKGPLDA